MAVFRCHCCDNYVDIDWFGCEEHPRKAGELICTDCHAEWEEQLSIGPCPMSPLWRLVDKWELSDEL